MQRTRDMRHAAHEIASGCEYVALCASRICTSASFRVLHVSASARTRVCICVSATARAAWRDTARRDATRANCGLGRAAARCSAPLYEPASLRAHARARGCTSVLTSIPNTAKRSSKLKTARLYMGAFCCLVLARHKQNAPYCLNFLRSALRACSGGMNMSMRMSMSMNVNMSTSMSMCISNNGKRYLDFLRKYTLALHALGTSYLSVAASLA